MEQMQFAAGQTISMGVREAARAFLIMEGKVELQGESGWTVQNPGDVFGEMSLVTDAPWSVAARAKTDVKLSAVSRAEFERFVLSNPVQMKPYLEALFSRLRSLTAHVETAKKTVTKIADNFSVIIRPLTRHAALTIPRDGLPVDRFPFRIGRAASDEDGLPPDWNDLWLQDHVPYCISRNHAAIEREPDALVIRDRGSSLGMFVNDVHIGGKSRNRKIALDDGENAVIFGGQASPYHFRVTVCRAAGDN